SNIDGLDVQTLLATRDAFDGIDRCAHRAPDHDDARDDWLDADAVVLIPAAASYATTPDKCEAIRAALRRKAAHMPALPEAEERRRESGVTVVPDFLANSATNAWWWWVTFGDVDGSWADSRELVTTTLRELTPEVLDAAADQGISPRRAAQAKVDANLASLHADVVPGTD